MSQEEFQESVQNALFSGKSEDPEIQLRQKKLNFFVKVFQNAKKNYLNRDDGVNLVAFFDKNTENLHGVFASCIDRMYEITKKEKRAMKGSSLALDLGTNRFWMDQSCFAYIKMMEKLISSSKTARNQFYSFLTEG